MTSRLSWFKKYTSDNSRWLQSILVSQIHSRQLQSILISEVHQKWIWVILDDFRRLLDDFRWLQKTSRQLQSNLVTKHISDDSRWLLIYLDSRSILWMILRYLEMLTVLFCFQVYWKLSSGTLEIILDNLY